MTRKPLILSEVHKKIHHTETYKRQTNKKLVVQGHSRSTILVPIESSYDFLLVINTNLRPILHRFQVMADHSSYFC